LDPPEISARGEGSLPFEILLRDLVAEVDGADGAIFLDSEGEAVQWYTRGDCDLLRLRAAYITVPLQSSRISAARLGLGSISHLVIEYEGAWFIVEELEGGYFFVLQLNSSGNLAQALDKVQPIVESLKREITAA
jgi:predicted regulator of Ras-like GTPase activity (Roadblock/LC7/MglB family)